MPPEQNLQNGTVYTGSLPRGFWSMLSTGSSEDDDDSTKVSSSESSDQKTSSAGSADNRCLGRSASDNVRGSNSRKDNNGALKRKATYNSDWNKPMQHEYEKLLEKSPELDQNYMKVLLNRNFITNALDSSMSAGKKQRNRSSCYRGVSWHKRDKAWVARAWIDGKNEHIGAYKTEEEAAARFDERLIKHFGPNVPGLNFNNLERAQYLTSINDRKKRRIGTANGQDISSPGRMSNDLKPDATTVGNGVVLDEATILRMLG